MVAPREGKGGQSQTAPSFGLAPIWTSYIQIKSTLLLYCFVQFACNAHYCKLLYTTNVTSVTEVRSASARLFAGKWRPLVSVITTLIMLRLFSPSSVISCAFSALCVYSKFQHHPHHQGYLCAKFSLFRGLHCWASPWRKIAYSIIRSLSQLIWCSGNRSACASKQTTAWVVFMSKHCFCYSIHQRSAPTDDHLQMNNFLLHSTFTT